ncbi:hypothetical protein DSO57_1014873 [Entomophthora muscae]|uniref:Uncharacterized protein n=1 Tax=Entomophthora muscae TaxID=34485 RepID=A0ACC2TSF7_9FUNG|nr:hypothetical protein DSO57_1014873 [Entomophthora muscae]
MLALTVNDIGVLEVLLFSCISYWLTNFILSFRADAREPPSAPNYFPIIGNTYQLRTRPNEFLMNCRQKSSL